MPFFACYLLISLDASHPGTTYIGFTVNPRRRLRQHNRCLVGGAVRTKGKGPWRMAIVVHGFPTKRQALQFEWHWQHPKRSTVLRDVSPGLRYKIGLKRVMALLAVLLTRPPWCSSSLSLRFDVPQTRALYEATVGHISLDIDVSIGAIQDWEIPFTDTAIADDSNGEADSGVEDGSDAENVCVAVAAAKPPTPALRSHCDVIELDTSIISVSSTEPCIETQSDSIIVIDSDDDE